MFGLFRHRVPLVAAGMMVAELVVPVDGAQAETAPQSCAVSSDLARFELPLSHVAERILAAEPVKIVAIGSSSTAGVGASSRALSYPSRLAVELRIRFPRVSITVINRGVGGEEAPQMLARFANDVIAEKPDLVLWQVGTNALLRGRDVFKVAETIRKGIDRLKVIGADVILIGPQFAPRLIEKPNTQRMVDLITRCGEAAESRSVPSVRRDALLD